MNMRGAGYERLAVGLGGPQEGYENVIHEHAQLFSIPNLGRPNQKSSPWS